MDTFRNTVIGNIKLNYSKIFNAERKIADFILQDPETAINLNVSELANASGVSDATVVRFSKHVGYDGYYQLRLSLSRDLGVLSNDGSNVDDKENIFSDFVRILHKISENIDYNKLKECADVINGANYVHICAVGNTSPLAQYTGFRLGRLGNKCTFNAIPEYFLNNINLAEKDDVLLAISQSGTSTNVIKALEIAKEKNIKIIAITGYLYSPVSKLADYLLLSSSNAEKFDYYKSYSHFNESAVIDALLQVVSYSHIKNNKINDLEMVFSSEKL